MCAHMERPDCILNIQTPAIELYFPRNAGDFEVGAHILQSDGLSQPAERNRAGVFAVDRYLSVDLFLFDIGAVTPQLYRALDVGAAHQIAGSRVDRHTPADTVQPHAG